MKTLLLGLVVALVLTVFMVVMMMSAVYSEFREWVIRSKTGGWN